MGLTVELVREGSKAEHDYESVLDACRHSLVQQTTFWREVIRELGPDDPYFLVARDGRSAVGCLPLYLYRGPLGSILTSVPQPGPLGGVSCIEGLKDKDSVYRLLVDEALRLAREKSCCLLSIITNPFSDDVNVNRRYLEPDCIFENFTQYISLKDLFGEGEEPLYLRRGGEGIIRSGNRNHIRKNLNKAARAGVEVYVVADEDAFLQWFAVHEKRHLEIGARPLERGLLWNIFSKGLTSGKAGLLVASLEGRVVGGLLFTIHNRIADAYMMSGDSRYFDRGIIHAIVDGVLREVQSRGAEIFNWQSSPARSSSVYEFKKRWGSREALYCYLTKVTGDCKALLTSAYAEVSGGYRDHFLMPLQVQGPTEGKKFGDFVKPFVRKQ